MQLSRVQNLPYDAAGFLLHRIRHAIVERDSRYMLAGIVELNNTDLGSFKKQPTKSGND